MPRASDKEPKRYGGIEIRIQVFALLLALSFCLLVAQLWRLQVVEERELREEAEDLRMTKKVLKADRGRVFDRNGAVLADNRPSVDVMLVPGECDPDRFEEIAATLEDLLGVPATKILAEIEDTRSQPYTQIPIKRNVSKADRIRVDEHRYVLGPGVIVVVTPQRSYPYGRHACQILGRLGPITRDEKEAFQEEYDLRDLVGKLGLERIYEELLHGRDGHMYVTQYASGRSQLVTDRFGVPVVAARDNLGHVIEIEGERLPPTPGEPLHTTLDIGLQAVCEDALSGEVGAIVVLEADTGAVLAMASNPTFAPTDNLGEIYGAPGNPALNRAIRENYPPGSVFKVAMASAALEEGVITEHTTFYCPGHFQINGKGRIWHCWKRGGHGTVSVVDALAFSCDVFFYNVGLELGIDRLGAWANKMGLGVETGIDLPQEIAGLVPSRAWKESVTQDLPVYDRAWFKGDTVNVSIGQGSMSTTPLQNAVMMACITNGGWRVTPHLNADLPPRLSDRLLSKKTLEVITRGMRKCVEKDPPAPTGTGNAAKIEGMAILGKTGSAQVMGLKEHEQYKTEEDIPKEKRDHAWFVAGVIDREPRIAICVLVEHGHHGSSEAAPLARKVIASFYGVEVPGLTVARLEGLN